ncbi:MAG: phage Tail Collar [Chthonomonadales bacterium]|nr:phage Tail Collar [Chthonomonadales bacterium]
MSQPYVGEIRMGGWSFAPNGWAMCNGASMSISQSDVLYTLLGTTYGGDGVNTFNLPDMRSRIPIHVGPGFIQGQASGSEGVSLTLQQIPSHNHLIMVSGDAGSSTTPVGFAPAMNAKPAYSGAGNPTPMSNVLGLYGGSQPHENRMPFLCITFVIALNGIFPSQG